MQQDKNALGSGPAAEQGVTDPFSVPRSPRWHEVERAFLSQHQVCAACDVQGEGRLQVHHIIPFEYCIYLGRPELEFNPKNLMALCEGPGTNDHHISVGHLGNFQFLNQVVEQDVTGPWRGLAKAAIELLADWKAREKWPNKPLSADECNRLTALMEQRYGLKPQESIDALIDMWWFSKQPAESN